MKMFGTGYLLNKGTETFYLRPLRIQVLWIILNAYAKKKMKLIMLES
jgi:hypothetical protein